MDSLECNVFVDFVDDIVTADGDIVDVNGSTSELTSGHMVLQISTSNGLSYGQLISTTTHEMSHAFGLSHYITDDNQLKEQWDKGINLPSIMIEDVVSVGIEKITELDLQKMGRVIWRIWN